MENSRNWCGNIRKMWINKGFAGGNIMVIFGCINLERGTTSKTINFKTKRTETSASTKITYDFSTLQLPITLIICGSYSGVIFGRSVKSCKLQNARNTWLFIFIRNTCGFISNLITYTLSQGWQTFLRWHAHGAFEEQNKVLKSSINYYELLHYHQ